MFTGSQSNRASSKVRGLIMAAVVTAIATSAGPASAQPPIEFTIRCYLPAATGEGLDPNKLKYVMIHSRS
jgi:hypothetical protein